MDCVERATQSPMLRTFHFILDADESGPPRRSADSYGSLKHIGTIGFVCVDFSPKLQKFHFL